MFLAPQTSHKLLPHPCAFALTMFLKCLPLPTMQISILPPSGSPPEPCLLSPLLYFWKPKTGLSVALHCFAGVGLSLAPATLHGEPSSNLVIQLSLGEALGVGGRGSTLTRHDPKGLPQFPQSWETSWSQLQGPLCSEWPYCCPGTATWDGPSLPLLLTSHQGTSLAEPG